MFFWREIQKADVLFEWQRNRTKKELFLVKGEDFNDLEGRSPYIQYPHIKLIAGEGSESPKEHPSAFLGKRL